MASAKVRDEYAEAIFDEDTWEWKSRDVAFAAILNSTVVVEFVNYEPDSVAAIVRLAQDAVPELVVVNVPPQIDADRRPNTVY